MDKTKLMLEFEQETGKQSAIVKSFAGGQALEMKSYPKLGPFDYNTYYIDWLEAKATAYDQLKQEPNLPYEYQLFLVYLQRNQGDFRKTVQVLTYKSLCSLEVMQRYALWLGISWEPEWR